MFINLEEMRADLQKYGNMPLEDYLTMKRNIAKYGEGAVKFYKENRLERINAAVAAQFGLTVKEYHKQINGGN